jgi:histidyl-tRNA synthetase
LYKAPRGTADILPEEQKYWQYMEAGAARLCQLYGYKRIETPVFEDSQLFTRAVGEGTDIVTKEMYIFKDLSDNSLALRPEGTAPVCRAYVEHGMASLPQPVKLFYFASIFRYERPQAGRYRQHHQFGFEAIGEPSAVLDAEVIDMALQYFTVLGLKQLSLQLNSIGCKNCRPQYLETLKNYYAEHVGSLCEDCTTRYNKNPLRLLDCKKESCQGVADRAPKSSEHLCPDCAAHFKSLLGYLDITGISYHINHRLVRGLDYYTRTVFEIQPPDEGSQSALGGGGRYDDLIEELGGKPTPALGFASGMERVILNLKRQNVEVPELASPAFFVAYMGEDAKKVGIRITSQLRQKGVPVILATGDRSLKAQMKQADGSGAAYSLILGDDEVKNKLITLRDMKSREQKSISLENVLQSLLDINK